MVQRLIPSTGQLCVSGTSKTGEGCCWFDLAADDLDFDDRSLSLTIWMKMMLAVMPMVEFRQLKWVHYALVEIPSRYGANCDGGGVM